MTDIASSMSNAAVAPRRFIWAGYLIGTAVCGFFDGILLHQVLQWHHLLSLVDSPVLSDIRMQILANGMFHVLTYVIAMGGLVLLWQSRQAFAHPSGERILAACVLLGFGVWNVIDIVLFHWILVIDRLRVDSANPLAWDIGWLVLFGLPFIVAALVLRHRAGDTGIADRPGANARALVISALTLGAGLFGALPPAGNRNALMVSGSILAPGCFNWLTRS